MKLSHGFYIRSIRIHGYSAWKTIERNNKNMDRILVTGNQMVVFRWCSSASFLLFIFFLWRLDSFVLFGCCTNGHAYWRPRQLHWTLRPGSQAKWKWVLWAHDARTFLELKSCIGRVVLLELTRHSDHHYQANRKYQILRHFDESPQMPYRLSGYDATPLIPPLWFWVMHREIRRYKSTYSAGMDLAWIYLFLE